MLYKNLFVLGLSLLISSQSMFSQEKIEEKVAEKEKNLKLEIKPYGFIKGDMVYSTGGVTSFGAASLAAPQVATGDDRAVMGFTAQHTRLGVKSTVGEKVKVGGLVEIDFFGNSFDANTKPRLRLGYASIATAGFEARMGQQWDLFSPNNANTNNTNGNMWYAGNLGFRRTQLQLSYTIANDKIAPMIQFSLGETTREEAGLGKDNFAGMPMIQARLSGKIMKKYIVGVSFVNGSYLEKEGTIVGAETLASDFKFSTSGIGVDFNLPFHKLFSLVGEFNTGTNLNNANLFSVAGSHSWSLIGGVVTEYNKKSMGYWVNATSNITDWFTFVLGYGADKNTTENLAIGTVEANTVIYTHFNFPIKHGFSVALELENINTSVKDADSRKANVISLAGKVAF